MSGYREPWSIEYGDIVAADGQVVAPIGTEHPDRIVESVNAMHGLHINDTAAGTVRELHTAAREFYEANLAYMKSQSPINQNFAALASRRLERALARFGVAS